MSLWDRHRGDRVQKLGGAVVSVLDRSGREDVRLHQPNASVVGLQGYVDHTLPSLLCITMILRVRRKFFEITAFPNSGIRARLCVDVYAQVEHK